MRIVRLDTRWLWIAVLAMTGCQPLSTRAPRVPHDPPCHVGDELYRTPVPVEKNMMSLPEYVIEPPDILVIEARKVVPKPPYRVEPMDVLQVNVRGTPEGQPIDGNYTVNPSGEIDLGAGYGRAKVAGLMLEDAGRAVETKLKQTLVGPTVSVTLAASAGQQQIAGEHLVGPDGRVNLGTYGQVYVTGMTTTQAQEAIEKHLSQYLDDPRISVDVFEYNSKVYYVIGEGQDFGERLQSFPITGNETVLDALARPTVNGLSRFASKKIWISRPAPDGIGCEQILPVNWADIAKGGSTATNYQILPGDRIFIAQDRLIGLDSRIALITAPVERIFNFVLLGTNTIQTVNNFPLGRDQ